ncbi:MAG TPA: SDR family oxidoreductase [Vicinamibacterales bacterium]|nr:SDR family oxidoreductase [Vicinamibacterales bacterium]
MKKEQAVLMGVAAGVAAVVGGLRLARGRRAIDFGGRIVVITGGSRGLGLVMARQLAAEGARLVLLARDNQELDRASRLLQETYHADVMALTCDIRRKEEVRSAVSRVLETWGHVDVLVNNAGVIQVGPLEHMKHQDFENAMATHFWGPLNLMLEIIPSMRRRGFGRIVNISSIGGRIAVPHLGPYCASKFALRGLSDAMRAELAPQGIFVTTVSPGLMRTGSPMNADMKGQHEAEYAWFAISDSLPGVSISAERAARKILEACRHGDPELTITPQARAAAMLNELTPNLVARLAALAAVLLPGPAGPGGDIPRPGRQSESRWAPSFATTLGDRAATLNNEV